MKARMVKGLMQELLVLHEEVHDSSFRAAAGPAVLVAVGSEGSEGRWKGFKRRDWDDAVSHCLSGREEPRPALPWQHRHDYVQLFLEAHF